ncbi:carbonic anhydrase 12 isoform X1 [Scyliorhinus canicula]|uniref:carbonic anhydrase 12 isoform X1 n=1 Tax=Scyliorhinus canicula TaxID=7830 RepID=UPI0018F39391|nr:carbonic anhydrase 12 isoform X1 [Scyliorhinus canicula]
MSQGRGSWMRGSVILIYQLLGLGSRVLASGASDWTYKGPHGEDHWAASYPECGNHQQSPIDFHTSTYDPSLEPIQLLGYNVSATETLSLTNNGHAVKLTLPPSVQMITMSHRYTAVQLHLHWGSETEALGSEHTVRGKHYPSELHVVHYNSEKYNNISMAQDKGDGLAVLGILLQIGPFNPAYEKIFSHLTEIRFKDKEIKMPGFNINDLLPQQLDQYYRYNGSLTTPPCYPSVTWTVFREPVQISKDQLSELQRDLFTSQGEDGNLTEMVNNYRHVQKLWKRRVFVSFHEDAQKAEHKLTLGVVLAIALCSVLCVMVALALSYFFLRNRADKATENRGVIYKPAARKEDGLSQA